MPQLTIIYGERSKVIDVEHSALIGDAITISGLPFEQPCAGRGTCGKCKILIEKGITPPDEIEQQYLSEGEIKLNVRLACRSRILLDSRIILSPIVVYSNKSFSASSRYKRETDVPLGLAVDLGTTTVAAFLTMLDIGEVCAGAATLNQQVIFGADVISRLSAAYQNQVDAQRLQRLAISSINQAIDALNLSPRHFSRVQNVTIVCNPAMHHLLSGLPIDKLAVMPFQPFTLEPNLSAENILREIFPEAVRVTLPPLIGGFVGSDALACLTYFGFDKTAAPIAAIDLGTNGEVMVTDGSRILTASTAAGPAFEGVNISCGSRAVDGAITKVKTDGRGFELETIADQPPIGLTGSGLISAIYELRKAQIILPNGRISSSKNGNNQKIILTPDEKVYITQKDIRELQKAKGAIRAAIDILLDQLSLKPKDLSRLILTGSFGGQVNINAVSSLGMIPPVASNKIESIANGAGYGAASFLTNEGFERGVRIAQKAEQINLDADRNFLNAFIRAMNL